MKSAPLLPGDGPHAIPPVLPRLPAKPWEAHVGGLMDVKNARVSIREPDRATLLKTVLSKIEAGESARIIAPGGAVETLTGAQVRAAVEAGGAS